MTRPARFFLITSQVNLHAAGSPRRAYLPCQGCSPAAFALAGSMTDRDDPVSARNVLLHRTTAVDHATAPASVGFYAGGGLLLHLLAAQVTEVIMSQPALCCSHAQLPGNMLLYLRE